MRTLSRAPAQDARARHIRSRAMHACTHMFKCAHSNTPNLSTAAPASDSMRSLSRRSFRLAAATAVHSSADLRRPKREYSGQLPPVSNCDGGHAATGKREQSVARRIEPESERRGRQCASWGGVARWAHERYRRPPPLQARTRPFPMQPVLPRAGTHPLPQY